MHFSTIIFKNLLRRPTRSLLTMIGIAIGIGAVVALTSVAWGFQKSWEKTYSARGTDLVVTKVVSQSPVPTPFKSTIMDQLPENDIVLSKAGLLTDLMGIENTPALLIFGWELNSFLWNHLKLIDGTWPESNESKEVVLGYMAAEMLDKKVGDPIQLDFYEFKVSGIFESPSLMENGAVILSLAQMQEVTEQEGEINFINFKLKPSVTESEIDQLKHDLKTQLAGFNAFSAGEIAQNNTAIQMAKAMSWATCVIALIVGAVGVTNTILMSIFERLHEIGILLAIGWKRSRILLMIVLESVMLSIAGGVIGVAGGIIAVKLMQNTSWMKGKIEGEISLQLVILAMFVALFLGFFGGLYPAYRGSRFEPMEALRHE